MVHCGNGHYPVIVFQYERDMVFKSCVCYKLCILSWLVDESRTLFLSWNVPFPETNSVTCNIMVYTESV